MISPRYEGHLLPMSRAERYAKMIAELDEENVPAFLGQNQRERCVTSLFAKLKAQQDLSYSQ